MPGGYVGAAILEQLTLTPQQITWYLALRGIEYAQCVGYP